MGAKENNNNKRKANEGEGRDETEESTMDSSLGALPLSQVLNIYHLSLLLLQPFFD